jgi:serine/threonine-protein kinase
MAIETSIDAELVGAMTGGYRVLVAIGSGAMGHVYEAEAIASGKHVALKVLHKSHQRELAARFLREGKTLALLDHPNIVQLVDMGQLDDGALFLATELVPGGSLRDLMDRGPLDHRRALVIIRQLLDALQAAHDLGVVHRDIKPENVMVGEGDVVKVLDFGVAKLLADTVASLGEANLTSVGFSVFGSAHYIAPESVTGQKVDARIDLYSTGAMLFEMVAGCPPFDDEDPTVILRHHAFDPPPTLQQAAPSQVFAPALEALVARALAKQPGDRYASAMEMAAAIDAVLRPPPEQHVPPRRSGTEVVRRRAPRTLVVGGAISAGLLVVILLATRNASGDGGRAEAAHADLKLGHAKFGEGEVRTALEAYERALRADRAMGSDKALRVNLIKVLDAKDEVATFVALDLLSSLTPPAQEEIVAYASTGKLEDARHRAVMLAERDGLGDQVDHVQSWSLDLQQASSCEERRATIQLLARSSDRRALVALKRARAVKCIEPDATRAIARIEAATK